MHRGGDDARGVPRTGARAHGGELIHPYDDPVVRAGQGTVGLELLEDVPDLAKVVIPVGGGGLAGGIADGACPASKCVGVRAHEGLTIADGIAVKSPGPWLDIEIVTVTEDEIAEAMFLLLERAKLVVEGAGAVGARRAAGRAHAARARTGATVAILSGGNVDAGLLAAVARRHESVRRPPPGPAHPHRRPARRPRPAARVRRHDRREPRRCLPRARGRRRCTSARPRSSSCSRRAGASTPTPCSAPSPGAGYAADVIR